MLPCRFGMWKALRACKPSICPAHLFGTLHQGVRVCVCMRACVNVRVRVIMASTTSLVHSLPSFQHFACVRWDGDLVASCDDATARVFTQSPERTADAAALAQFDETVAAARTARQAQQVRAVCVLCAPFLPCFVSSDFLVAPSACFHPQPSLPLLCCDRLAR